MSRASRVLAGASLFVLLVSAARPLAAQPAKKVLTFADESHWRTASTPVMSPDGTHIAYSVWPTEGDGESVVRHVPSGRESKFPRGGGAVVGGAKFTPDGKRVLLAMTPTKAETDKAKADKAKPEDVPSNTLAVVDLATGKVTDRFPQSGAFFVDGDGAGFVVYRKPTRLEPRKDDAKADPAAPPATKGGKSPAPAKAGAATPPAPTFGSDLVIRDIDSKTERTITDVSEFDLTRDGKLLVYAVASKADEHNGVYTMNPRTGAAEPIKTGYGRYTGLTWDEGQKRLAYLYDDSTVPNRKVAPPPRPAGTTTPVATPVLPANYRVFVWDRAAKPVRPTAARFPVLGGSGLSSLIPVGVASNAAPTSDPDEVVGPGTPGIPAGWKVAGGTLAFSPDGTRLYVNTAPKRETPPASATPPKPDDFQLDLWHWKDERLQPMQKLQAEADRARTYLGVVLLDTRQFRQLSDATLTVGRAPSASDWAVGTDDRKYRIGTGYALPLADYSVVNVKTGEKKPLLPGFGGYSTPTPLLSPTGKHLLAFDGKDWFTVSVADGKRTNLTAKLGVKFQDEDDDHPGAPPPAGLPQWTADGNSVLVNDRYDLWKLAADGSAAENLTKIGRAQQTRFTLLRVPVQDQFEPFHGVDLTRPQLLGAENLHTRDAGYYRLDPGAARPRLLILGPRRYGQPTKAKNADIYLLTVQTFFDHPDHFVTPAEFHELKRVTDINPKAREYNWGRAEIVHYKSADGVPLSGVLVKPENFDPSKKYPMVVYIYERLSHTVHTFRPPAAGTNINPTFYASNGYLVFMPDIAYKVGLPGQSALKCVLPAIQAVADKGYVDEARVGIQGHSWGGYQIAYMVTQTERFKAAVAGAPVSNMTSAYGGIRWGSGLTRQFQYEWTQSRIGATLWEAPMKYLENSPLFMADRVKTPLMMLHNDQDDAVPWYQGIEYYLALRRLGKECYLLNYNGQPHNLTSRAAARDFAVRMFQFFEHHLKGKPAPRWMTDGVPYLERDRDQDEVKKLLGPEKK